MFGQNLDFSAIVHGRKKSVSYRFTPDDFPTFYWVKIPSLFSMTFITLERKLIGKKCMQRIRLRL
jgi:hypothetical protein